MVKKYFNWLQKDVPTGEVEQFPEINRFGETNVKGIYVIGDLTGIPLLKLASESGAKIIHQWNKDEKFQESRNNKDKDIFDFIIIGGGPAGIAAGLEASKNNYKFKILESAKPFNTIANFPKGKPIYSEPQHIQQVSEIKIRKDIKETLLEDLYKQIENKNLPISKGVDVQDIIKHKDHFDIQSQKETFKALRILLAVGKSGNPRQLNIPGEHLSKVFNRLIDPQEAEGEDVLVVGGGDSALETAIAVSEYAASVSLSYRNSTFSRPKAKNIEKLNRLVEEGKIKLFLDSQVKEISSDTVILKEKNKNEIPIANSMVFVMIGKQPPLEFFKKIGIKVSGSLSKIEKWMFFALLSFSGVIYFGKAGVKALLTPGNDTVTWGYIFSQLLNPEFWTRFLLYPFKGGFFENAGSWNWTSSLAGITGYLCFIAFIISGFRLLVYFFKSIKNYTSSAWKSFKYTYFILLSLFFCLVYFGNTYFQQTILARSPSFWYTFLYSLTIVIFGFRRIYVKPTIYIKRQTWTLMLIQFFPLFLLPEIILPLMKSGNLLGSKKGFILTQVFPGGDFGHAYRLILAWPLNIYGLVTDNITSFWLVYTLFFTFVIIPYLVIRWGKGAYCGWICSCGALAETLGDEYRSYAPHGTRVKKWENAGQWILLAAVLITVLKLTAVLGGIRIPLIHTPRPSLLDFSRMIYSLVVDIIFAGVLGVGVYFFLSGRIWCRFFCPLAALMHIYTRFSRYRIFADKKKCISCNICTKVCHMGIDVMNYANKGIPMDDVECVRCSACIVHCPMEVLYFGSLPGRDIENRFYKINPEKIPLFDKSKWQQGLK